MRFLIVDDDPDQARTLCRMLGRKLAAECETVSDLQSAFSAASSGRFEAVILDLGIPHTPGGEVQDGFETIKQIHKFHPIPIIVCTGIGDEDMLHAASKAGAIDFVVKGAGVPEMLAARLGLMVNRHNPDPMVSARIFDMRQEQAKQLPQGTGLSLLGMTFSERGLFYFGYAALFCGMMWLQLKYVSIDTYTKDREKDVITHSEESKKAEAQRGELLTSIRSLNDTMIRWEEKMKGDTRRDETLSDHETRIRTLERK